MKITKNLGLILLAVWLILNTLVSLFGLSFNGLDIVLAILAISAGVAIIFNLRGGSLSGSLGMILLGLWLLMKGLIPLLNFSFNGLDLVMAILALAAGVLILIKR